MNRAELINLPLRLLAPLAGLAVGVVAVWAQSRFAPVGLFPLSVGLVAGACIAAVLKIDGRTTRASAATAATIGAALCLATIHYGSFLSARAAAHAKFKDERKLLESFDRGAVTLPSPPFETFAEYVRHEWDVGRRLGPVRIDGGAAAAWWFIDGLLVTVGAVATAILIAGPRAADAATETKA